MAPTLSSGFLRSTFMALLTFGAAIGLVAALRGQPLAETLYRENGVIELPTVLGFLASAVGASVAAIRLWHFTGQTIAGAALLAFGVSCLVIAGEEVAWGQWLVHYDTPAQWREFNLQGEMTLHNVEGLQGKSEVFRLAFGIGGLVGIALGRLRIFVAASPSVMLAPWFLLIALFATGELVTDWVTLGPLGTGLRAKLFSELQELIIAGVALAYSLNACSRPAAAVQRA